MEKWEYFVGRLTHKSEEGWCVRDRDRDAFISLSDMGRGGWDLVAVAEVRDRAVLIFKRPLLEESESEMAVADIRLPE